MSAGEIVAKLANCSEPIDRLDGFCMLCRSFDYYKGIEGHSVDCPWRLAREQYQVSAGPA